MVLLHSSPYKITKFYDKSQYQNFKPSGIWYAQDNYWIDFVRNNLPKSEMKRLKYTYAIKLHYTYLEMPNKDKVLKIRNIADFNKFTLMYGIKEGTFINIKWKKVAKHFAGIELIPFPKSKRFLKYGIDDEIYTKFKIKNDKSYMSWIISWDIPSGCVWNTIAISSFKTLCG